MMWYCCISATSSAGVFAVWEKSASSIVELPELLSSLVVVVLLEGRDELVSCIQHGWLLKPWLQNSRYHNLIRKKSHKS